MIIDSRCRKKQAVLSRQFLYGSIVTFQAGANTPKRSNMAYTP